MPLKQIYAGKRILLTGGTGFMGKVLLEKILYSLPEVGMIYLVIRGKKGFTFQERFKKEVINTPCFNRLRNLYGHKFAQFIQAKVRPIQGDLIEENVGLSQSDLAEVRTHCNVIINCAASVSFQARLDVAINTNILGSLRVQRLAQSCEQLDIFTHVSTAYVNCNLSGTIREQIYQSDSNPENDLSKLLKLPLKQLIEQTPKIIHGYPNTYTFTKAMCERLIKKRKGKQSICIVRPSIVNASYSDPFPGWIDSISGTTPAIVLYGLGLGKEAYGFDWTYADMIPVDIAINIIIVASAFNMKKANLSIYHAGSTDRNPIIFKQNVQVTFDYWRNNPSQQAISTPGGFLSSNKLSVQLKRFGKKIPVWMYSKMAPYLGKQHVRNSSLLMLVDKKIDEAQGMFQFFITHSWIFESRNVQDLINFLTTTERTQFLIEIAEIDMRYYMHLNNYGIQKYILKENIDLPSQNSNILMRQNTYFSDIKWALTEGVVQTKERSAAQFKSQILSSPRVLQAIQQQIIKKLQLTTGTIEAERKNITKQAQEIVSDMVGEFKMPVVRFLAWTLHKFFKKIYEKISINMEVFDTFREIEEKSNIPIVLIPTHKSYLDFLIVSYIFFAYKLKLPYTVADEALMSMVMIPFLIHSSGVFFYRKKQYRKSKLYKAIFEEYIQQILMKGQNMQFFIQGTRSRTGKIHPPRFQVLNIIMDAVFSEKVKDVCLVPLTINYEKVLEADTFLQQLLGQEKVEESLLRVLKAIPLLKTNFGRVYVEFCNPIFVQDFIKQQTKANPKLEILSKEKWKSQIVTALGEKIVQKMTKKLVIMSTGVVSAVLLMHRKGITEELLRQTVNSLTKYILRKGYRIGGLNENSSRLAVRNSLSFLNQIIKKTKNTIFELQISAGDEFHKILMLSYYRNTIVHAFLPQAFVGLALASFGKQLSYDDGVPLSRVHEETIFLAKVLRFQFSLPYNLESQSKFNETVEMMIKEGIISFKEGSTDKLVINPELDQIILFFISILRPIIECYWSVLIYLMTISNRPKHRQAVPSLQKFHSYIQWYMESLLEEKVIENIQSCSLETIKSALGAYEKKGLVKVSQISRKEYRIQTIAPVETYQQMQNKLKNFLRSMVNNSMTSPMEIAKSSMLGENQSKL